MKQIPGKAGMVIDQNFTIGCSTNSIKILELQRRQKSNENRRIPYWQ